MWFNSFCQPKELNNYNVIWNNQSKNAAETMPCGGGDIGTNVWVENGEVFLYLQQSGWFDENNSFLKAGRIRINLSPNPFAGNTFKQELVLKDGSISIKSSNGKLLADIVIWVDMFNSVVHIEVQSNQKIMATAAYESWRYNDRILSSKENNANSWKWAKQVKVVTQKDSICFNDNAVQFFHQNNDSTVFDYTVKQQGLNGIKLQLTNPLQNLVFGGFMLGSNMKPAGTTEGKYVDTDFKSWRLKSTSASKTHSIQIGLQVKQNSSLANFLNSLKRSFTQRATGNQQLATINWWHNYWDKSFIYLQPNATNNSSTIWQVGRNYQLFRYMLGCNAFGKFPTKFNGGLFTVDPVFTDSSIHGTPDFRNWGGGTFTAQNQRLVYWPMLKNGDIDLMKPQFDFYKNLLQNAELRTETYWHHNGASFTEQMENYGLPNPAEYGYKRPADFDKGLEYNAWLEYEWDTALEFCLMILETEKYQNKNISVYLPLIESCLIFFDEHYQYLAKQRGSKALDADGKLVLYPGSGGETFKMAYNSTSTIAALQTVTKSLLQSNYLAHDRKKYFTDLLNRIPLISFRNVDGHATIAPAKSWERINNSEPTQLYPVFPWGIYGVGKPGLDTAINTYLYDTLAIKFRSYLGWKQDNIFAAKLGLTNEAAKLTILKLKISNNKFPAFWGPGFDWTPDHNQGGSGMIGLQEMLLQTDEKKIILFAAWPKDWDVHFKLHAPYNTTVEAIIK
ncbi:MAG: hypothetical protein H7068_10395, partial [Pedobacter sp.]|nr:hypothetical protein [Chitinophagaceae bacterium]